MKYFHIALILCASLYVVSCAPTQPRVQETQAPPERIVQKGYSLEPPSEKGWRVVGRNPNQVALRKESENPDESYIIQGGICEGCLLKIGPYKTGEDFARLIKEGEARIIDRQRYKIIQHDVSAYNEKATDCAKSYLVMEDNAATRASGNTGVMIIEALALVCAHPEDKSTAVQVSYSHRYYPGHRDTAFLEKATTVLNSVEFTDL